MPKLRRGNGKNTEVQKLKRKMENIPELGWNEPMSKTKKKSYITYHITDICCCCCYFEEKCLNLCVDYIFLILQVVILVVIALLHSFGSLFICPS